MTRERRSAPSVERPLGFVTGGSSRIGFEPAKQLAQHGHDVAISDSSDRVHASAERLRELGVEAWSHQADAGTHGGVEAFWRFVEHLRLHVDVAVLNVGIATGGAFADIRQGGPRVARTSDSSPSSHGRALTCR